ncbi:hypothetical protein E0I74_07415 [Rhizobium laguerreae]|nr:hypothetical protein [Rhizobium laguerreae]NKM18691.1 hypothetical protein [Rhizobium laguerreae]TBX80692.1 hypothetical protein E0I74_07415 [Rhizobium laguerreae]TBY08912.1 hypothetical protein E0J21_12165 [Rhizobium laguerreae]TBY13191.1 hypothetical protein E0I94_08800 [Rhizobium laguerreae]
MRDLLSETDVTWLMPLNFYPRRLFPSGFYLGCASSWAASAAAEPLTWAGLPARVQPKPDTIWRNLLQSRGSF